MTFTPMRTVQFVSQEVDCAEKFDGLSTIVGFVLVCPVGHFYVAAVCE
jgi:hypothetical protein